MSLARSVEVCIGHIWWGKAKYWKMMQVSCIKVRAGASGVLCGGEWLQMVERKRCLGKMMQANMAACILGRAGSAGTLYRGAWLQTVVQRIKNLLPRMQGTT